MADAPTGFGGAWRRCFRSGLVSDALAARPLPVSDDTAQAAGNFRRVAALFAYSRRALVFVWTTNRALSIGENYDVARLKEIMQL